MAYQNCEIVGNLGGDAEMDYTQGGTARTRWSVAVSKNWIGADGVKHEQSQWFRCTAFAKQAEFAEKWVKKGKPFMFKGEVTARGYIDRDGTPQASLDMLVREIIFLPDRDFKGNGGGDNGQAAPAGAPLDESDVPF